MPWTTADVEKHKKGLSDEGKKRWVSIANGVLKSCMSDGGSEGDCAGKAIRIANSKVGTNSYFTYKTRQGEVNKAIAKKLDGKDYLVVPVVMMVQGVHSGNQGPLLHKIEDLGAIPEVWNGIPIVITHPVKEGTAVSANSPEILEESSVGQVFNTVVEGLKLKAEAWLNVERLKKVSPDVLSAVNNNQPVEVSVGVFNEYEFTEGEYEGEKYTAIAYNHKPDHLALLPGEIGACSLEDGCGLGVNSKKKGGNDVTLQEMMLSINKAGYAISQIGTNEDIGFRQRMDLIYNHLQSLNSDNVYHYVEEVYDGYVIYSKSKDGETKLFKQAYKLTDDGRMELDGSALEVRRKVEYVTNMTRSNINNHKEKEDRNMPNDKCTPCVEKKVNELITNSKGRWVESDREFLQTLTEEQLDKMAPQVIEKVKEVQVNVLSDEDKAALAAYKAEQKEKKDRMIKEIQANTSVELWPDTELNALTDNQLKRLFDSVHKEKEEVDFSLYGAGMNVNSGNKEEIEPLYPAGVEMK